MNCGKDLSCGSTGLPRREVPSSRCRCL